MQPPYNRDIYFYIVKLLKMVILCIYLIDLNILNFMTQLHVQLVFAYKLHCKYTKIVVL